MNKGSVRPARLSVVVACVALGAFFVAAMIYLVGRPLWFDEYMAETNYPLTDPASMFAPLPFHDQAAPPLFNVLMTLLWPLTFPMQRLVLGAIVLTVIVLALWWLFRSRWSVLAGLATLLAIPLASYMATELKYYGLEMAGCLVLAAWYMTRDADRDITWRDVAIVLGSMITGIATIVVAGTLVGLAYLEILARKGWPAWRALLPGLAAAVLAIAYYLVIRHATSVQMAVYGGVYNTLGLYAIVKMAGLSLLVVDWSVAFVIIAIAGLALAISSDRIRILRAGIAAGLLYLLFTVLSVLQIYPAIAPRHVLWVGSLAVAISALSVEEISRFRGPIGVRLAIGAVLALLVVGAVQARRKLPDLSQGVERNAVVLRWLENAPPSDVGLWFGAQAMVEVERARGDEAIAKHRYHGWMNPRSVLPGPPLSEPTFRKRPYSQIAAYVEPRRSEPGAIGRFGVYHVLQDYTAPAKTLVAQMPRGKTAYIISTFVPWDADEFGIHLGQVAMQKALTDAGCRYTPKIRVRRAFVLEIFCPPAPAD